DPFRVEADVTASKLLAPMIALPDGVSLARMRERAALLQQLDRHFAGAMIQPEFTELDAFYARAIEIVRSPDAQKALDLEREPAVVRERYGDHLFGKGCLLARRLIEAGVRLATVYWHYEGPDDSPVWDTHGNNFAHLRQRLMPPTDRAVS